MKRVLIVSPHFPPVNMPDLHRVRQSLPYLREFGWEATTLAVTPERVEGNKDPHLAATIPKEADVRYVGALNQQWTRRFGLGNVGLRSLPYMRAEGDRLLSTGNYDLVFFSTTMFPVTALGPYWKMRHGTPFVIDMQDPWRSDYYLTVPPEQRPPKFWFSYGLDSLLEALTMRQVDGLLSVSQEYCDTLQVRYRNVRAERCRVIPFGGAQQDFDVLGELTGLQNDFFDPSDGLKHVVYVGAGGHFMSRAARGIFGALADGLNEQPGLFEPVRLHFIGTDYAPEGKGRQTIRPISESFGVADRVSEYPARVPYFTALHLLQQASMAILPGSVEPAYTASKLYPYILARRPMLAVFNEASSVVRVLRETRAGEVVTFGEAEEEGGLRARVRTAWAGLLERLPFTPDTDWDAFEPYTARAMTRRQAAFFDEIVAAHG